MAVLKELRLRADPAAWRTAGFVVGRDGIVDAGGVRLHLTSPTADEEGAIAGWTLEGVTARELDGLPTAQTREARAAAPTGCASSARTVRVNVANPPGDPRPPLAVVAVDHVVVLTPDLERTTTAFAAAGLHPRRVRDAGAGTRQAFYVLGPALAEVVARADPEDPGAPARFWGLTLAVRDLDAAARHLGDHLGPVRDAVQPGRRIATVRAAAGLGVRVALMTPRHAAGGP